MNVLGVGIDAINLPAALRSIDAAIRSGTGGYVCVTGVHGVMEAQRDSEFRRVLNHSLLTTPDGMPMVWAGWAAGFARMNRVYGPDLLLEVCQHSLVSGYRHFFFGGNTGIAELLSQRLRDSFPGLNVVGVATPPFRPLTTAEEERFVRDVASTRPHIIWVGISTPKQERLMARLHARVAPAIMIGVGAAFDIHSGRVRQAPRWMQRSGLEWAFRATTEPRRLIPRYARNNLAFVYRIGLQQLGLARYPLDS